MKLRYFLLLAVASFTAKAAEPLMLIHTIPLPGVKGRFDHFACCDSIGHRLTLAARGNNTGELFDLAENKLLRTITGLRKPIGTLLLSEPDCFYFANGDHGTFRTIDSTARAWRNSAPRTSTLMKYPIDL